MNCGRTSQKGVEHVAQLVRVDQRDSSRYRAAKIRGSAASARSPGPRLSLAIAAAAADRWLRREHDRQQILREQRQHVRLHRRELRGPTARAGALGEPTGPVRRFPVGGQQVRIVRWHDAVVGVEQHAVRQIRARGRASKGI